MVGPVGGSRWMVLKRRNVTAATEVALRIEEAPTEGRRFACASNSGSKKQRFRL